MNMFTYITIIFAVLCLITASVVWRPVARMWRSMGRDFMARRSAVFILCSGSLLAGAVAMLGVASVVLGMVADSVTFTHYIHQKERVLLYQTDHVAIRDSARSMLADTNGFPADETYYRDSEQLPKPIRDLRPSFVWVYSDRTCILIEMGGGFYHYGFSVFAKGQNGMGTKELLPGLWYYSETDSIPRRR